MTEHKQAPEKKSFLEEALEGARKIRPYVAIALVIALMTASSIPDIKYKVGVLLALGGALFFLSFDIYKLVTGKVNEIKSSLKEINENVKGVHDPLYKAAFSEGLGKPEIQVANKLFKASKEAARQLKHPKQVFNNYEDYTNELIRRINQMMHSKRGKINAACGEKDWELDGTQRWFDKNYEALKSNVSINRIFIEEIGWDADAACQQMQEQANKGINVRLAGIKGLKNHPLLNNIPRGFGFVIFDNGVDKPQVIVHNDPATEKSVLFDDPMIVGQFVSTFNELSSDAYSKVILSNNQTDAGYILEKQILHKSDELTMHIRHLLAHRFSNLQLNFINWRLGTELNKLRSVINGELPIYALDKYSYLSDIFGHLQRQLREGDTYQTITTVDVWSGNSIGSKKFLRSNVMALKAGAHIDRVVFIDEKRLNDKLDTDYHKGIKYGIDLFNSFSEKDNKNYSLNFFISEMRGDHYEILQHAPVTLITEYGNKNRLGLYAHHVSNTDTNSVPFLDLKFYFENDSDVLCDNFIENFKEMKSNSIGIKQMEERLLALYPKLVTNIFKDEDTPWSL